VPADLSARGEGAWHLLDYDGDGRDDLLVSGPAGTGWRVYTSTGTGFDASQNRIGGAWIPSYNARADQVQLADLNGDGLTDVVYPANGALRARLMERGPNGFAWGAERTITVDQGSLPPLHPECGNLLSLNECWHSVGKVPIDHTGFLQILDFNGDAASDLLMRISKTEKIYHPGPGCNHQVVSNGITRQRLQAIPGSGRVALPHVAEDARVKATARESCWVTTHYSALHALVVSSISASEIVVWNYGQFANGSPGQVVPADFNGDGLTDLAVRYGGTTPWQFILNAGNGFKWSGQAAVPPFPEHTRFVDVNGDGRADLVYLTHVGANKVYWVRHALPGGGFAAMGTALPGGGNARLCEGSACNPAQSLGLFTDVDGDGQLDFIAVRLQNAPTPLVARAQLRHAPRDVITAISNGFGAKTQISYAPLTNREVYRRGNTSRNTLNWGRGSPVLDLLAPLYVVSRASSSAPIMGNANALATVHYRYSGGKVQGGGRGFLGFAEIVSFDPNQGAGVVATQTRYAQAFPFTGMPTETVRRVFVNQGHTVPACLGGTISDACFGPPGQAFAALGGSMLSSNLQVWEADTDIGAAVRAFAPGEQRPVHVRTAGSEEMLRDPFTAVHTSKVTTAFVYGAYGNLAQTTVDTWQGQNKLSSVTTSNTYAQDNRTRWRLGRLTQSVLTHQRPGMDSVQKTAVFQYAMSGPATGLLAQERSGAGFGAEQESLKQTTYDVYGNPTHTVTCAHPATPAACANTLSQFQPGDARTVHRVHRQVFDGNGRYPVETWEPFKTTSGHVEVKTLQVLARDLLGAPTHTVDHHGVDTWAVHGALGRAYAGWVETVPGSTPATANGGIHTRTTYRWCGSSGNQVACPSGARFRQQVTATAAPARWSYHDVLGRPVLTVTESANVGVSGRDASAVCTRYEQSGRPVGVSVPFFLPGTVTGSGPPVVPSTCLEAGVHWASTRYDLLGRPVSTQQPRDGGGVDITSIAYSGRLTTVTDPRGNASKEERNALGELVKTTDALGTHTTYRYRADGLVAYVDRNVGRGLIRNSFVYGTMGRVLQHTDPDRGKSQFSYNALGERIG